MDSALIEQVRQQYSKAAREAIQKEFSQLTVLGACCGEGDDDSCCSTAGVDHVHIQKPSGAASFGSALYPAPQLAVLPTISVAVSSGCGNPVGLADLCPGEVVLDLGCGGGIDAFLAAQLVGSDGKVFGLEMTEQMLALAKSSQRAAGFANVEFLFGYMESIPLPAGCIDVVISNRSVNLSCEKDSVFAEIVRALKPGGRLAAADVVASDELSGPERTQRAAAVDCVAGVLSFSQYRDGLGAAGLEGVEVRPTHEVAPDLFAASIAARRPQT
ncbi:MAG: methyltransferase domain-containing protein [Actinomycetota bacterium]